MDAIDKATGCFDSVPPPFDCAQGTRAFAHAALLSMTLVFDAIALENRVDERTPARLTAGMVSMPDIKRYCDAIAAAFKPRRIILFGSHAYGQPNEDSDVDVLVVMPKSRRVRRDTAVKIQLKVPADFPVDVLVRGESDVERRVRQRDMFMTHITSKGRVMYEAVHA